MAIVRCKNNHYYNNSDSPSCPYCSGESAIGKTIPLNGSTEGFEAPAADFPKTNMERTGSGSSVGSSGLGKTEMLDYKATEPVGNGGNIPPTEFVPNKEYGKTIFMDSKQNSEIKPVRGWLVVVEGEKCGMDFRLHAGRNTIGRGKSNDVCFEFDQTISMDKCCIITYDDRNNKFYIQPGEGINCVYYNGVILLQPTQIKDNDIVEIGKTKLVFRSLCNDTFNY